MKYKISSILIALFFLISCTSLRDGTNIGGFDRSKQPQPGPPPTVNLGKPSTFELSNGLKVIVMENHKLPRASARLTIDNKPYFEGDKAGVSHLLGSLLGSGTKNISKDEFNEEVDYLGANVNFGSNSASMNSLSKFFPRVFELMADAALHPVFTQEEFDKEVALLLDGIKAGEKDVNTIGNRVESALAFGSNHPFGEFATEETVENVKLQDVKKLYDTYFKPNNAYLVVTGDVNTEEIKVLVDKHFSDWKSVDLPEFKLPEVKNISDNEIDFIDMPNASQTRIRVLSTTKLKMNDPDFFPVLVANQILGGDYNAYLNMNLREDKGFTYGAFSGLPANRYVSKFSAGANVRHEVADSAIVEIMKELDRIRTEKVDALRLKNTKANFAGKFVRALENPEKVAQYALNTEINDLPDDFYETYLQKINAVTPADILQVSQKYFNNENARIVVTSKAIDVLPNLDKLGYPINYFDKYSHKTDKPKLPEAASADVTAESVIKKYLEAIGGRAKLKNIETIVQESQMEMQGMTMQQIMKSKTPNLISQETLMMGQVASKIVFDGSDGYMIQMGNKMPLPDDQKIEFANKKGLIDELMYDSPELELNLIGISPVNSVDAYKIEITSQSGEEETKYYNKDDGLLIRQELSMKNPMSGEEMTQTTDFGDYKAVNGIKFPFKISTQVMGQEIEQVVNDIKINVPLTLDDFK